MPITASRTITGDDFGRDALGQEITECGSRCGISGRVESTSTVGVVHMDTGLDAPALRGSRIELEPLREDDADEMAPLMADTRLHDFIGGQPATAQQLRQRFRRQAIGRSPDGTQYWLNWIVRRTCDHVAVGTVQATVTDDAGRLAAEVAWVIATDHQGHGFAKEAAQVMIAWLRRHEVTILVAHVHPEHAASAAVARSAGLVPTSTLKDGEVRWRG